jgi:hypothetical protein
MKENEHNTVTVSIVFLKAAGAPPACGDSKVLVPFLKIKRGENAGEKED